MNSDAPVRYAEVVVNAAKPSRMTSTYSVPAGLDVSHAQAVFVPFGPRILQGVVRGFSTETHVEHLAQIEWGPAEIRVPHAASSGSPFKSAGHDGESRTR